MVGDNQSVWVADLAALASGSTSGWGGAGRRGRRKEKGLGSRGLECQAQDVGIRKCCDFLETAL